MELVQTRNGTAFINIGVPTNSEWGFHKKSFKFFKEIEQEAILLIVTSKGNCHNKNRNIQVTYDVM